MSAAPKDLFEPYTTPPSPLHAAVQTPAKRKGGSPRLDRDEQQNQQRAAGKKSACVRKKRGELRLQIIQAAYASLNLTNKFQPFSEFSIDALQEQYLFLLGGDSEAPLTRSPPTQDELELFASRISTIPQLPDSDRIDALERDCRIFANKGSGAPRCRARLTDDELDFRTSIIFAIAKLSETDRQVLQKVSRETLRKGLMQLGIKSRRRAQRSG